MSNRTICNHIDSERFLTACNKYCIDGDFYCFAHRDKNLDDDKDIGICSHCFNDNEKLWTTTCCHKQYCQTCFSSLISNCYCRTAIYVSITNPIYAKHNFNIQIEYFESVFKSDKLDISYYQQIFNIKEKKKIKKLESRLEVLKKHCSKEEKSLEEQKNEALKEMLTSTRSTDWTQWYYFKYHPEIKTKPGSIR